MEREWRQTFITISWASFARNWSYFPNHIRTFFVLCKKQWATVHISISWRCPDFSHYISALLQLEFFSEKFQLTSSKSKNAAAILCKVFSASFSPEIAKYTGALYTWHFHLKKLSNFVGFRDESTKTDENFEQIKSIRRNCGVMHIRKNSEKFKTTPQYLATRWS